MGNYIKNGINYIHCGINYIVNGELYQRWDEKEGDLYLKLMS
jgi:hypothetical protein